MAIFVGGQSSRMGTPKGCLRVPDTDLSIVEHLVRQGRSVGLTPMLVGDATPYANEVPEVQRVADDPLGAGPLGGLKGALKAASAANAGECADVGGRADASGRTDAAGAREDASGRVDAGARVDASGRVDAGARACASSMGAEVPVIAVACDMPFVTGEVLERLRDFAPGASMVASRRRADGPWEPMLGRYQPSTVLPVLGAAIADGVRSFQALFARAGDALVEFPVDHDFARALRDWDAPNDLLESPR